MKAVGLDCTGITSTQVSPKLEYQVCVDKWFIFNILKSEQNCHHFANDIFKCIFFFIFIHFLNKRVITNLTFENVVCNMLVILLWLTFVIVLFINSLWPSNNIWYYRTWSILVQEMAYCLMAPTHYLSQRLLIINEVSWHSPMAISQEMLNISILDISLKITILKLLPHLPWANELSSIALYCTIKWLWRDCPALWHLCDDYTVEFLTATETLRLYTRQALALSLITIGESICPCAEPWDWWGFKYAWDNRPME